MSRVLCFTKKVLSILYLTYFSTWQGQASPFKNSLKKLHFPTVFILSLPTLLLLVKQNTVYEEV